MACLNFARSLYNFKSRKIFLNINFVRHKSDSTKVVLLNCYSKVGIFTAYLLKKTCSFNEIWLQEFRNVIQLEGIVKDLNNINTTSTVICAKGRRSLDRALKDANLVVMLEKEIQYIDPPDKCKKPRKVCKPPHLNACESVNKVFLENADLCANIAETYAKVCPSALLVVSVKPLNSTMPLICKIASSTNHNVNFQRIIGFTALDQTVASILLARKVHMVATTVKVPIIGGTSSHTTVPLFSQIKVPEPKQDKPPKDEKKGPPKDAKGGKKDEKKDTKGKLNKDDYKSLTETLRKYNELYLLDPRAPLATAAVTSNFILSLGKALGGKEQKEVAFIKTNLLSDVSYLSGIVRVGPGGVQKMLPFPKMSEYEKLLLESVAYYLKADIKRGEDYADKYLKKARL